MHSTTSLFVVAIFVTAAFAVALIVMLGFLLNAPFRAWLLAPFRQWIGWDDWRRPRPYFFFRLLSGPGRGWSHGLASQRAEPVARPAPRLDGP